MLKNYDFSPKEGCLRVESTSASAGLLGLEVMLAWLSMGFSVAFTYPLVFSTFRDSFTAPGANSFASMQFMKCHEQDQALSESR